MVLNPVQGLGIYGVLLFSAIIDASLLTNVAARPIPPVVDSTSGVKVVRSRVLVDRIAFSSPAHVCDIWLRGIHSIYGDAIPNFAEPQIAEACAIANIGERA